MSGPGAFVQAGKSARICTSAIRHIRRNGHTLWPGLSTCLAWRRRIEALRCAARPEDTEPEAERLALDLSGVSRWRLARLEGRGAICTQRGVPEDAARQDLLELRRTA